MCWLVQTLDHYTVFYAAYYSKYYENFYGEACLAR